MNVSRRNRQTRSPLRRTTDVERLESRLVLSSGVTEFPVATTGFWVGNGLDGITKGRDGEVWFTNRGNGQIGSINAAGDVTTYQSGMSRPASIVLGADGDLWFTTDTGIGRFDPRTQVFDSFSTQASGGLYQPESIAVGADGNLWFTDSIGGDIGRITPTGQITAFSVAPFRSTYVITTGPNGDLWFTGARSGNGSEIGMIGRITTSGDVTTFPDSAGGSLGAPYGITTGSDGNLWFTDLSTHELGRITPQGDVTEFPTDPISPPSGWITTGPDGNVWFATQSGVGRMTPQGTLSIYIVTSVLGPATQITTGPDGALWFTHEASGFIGRIDPAQVSPSLTVTESSITIFPDVHGPYNDLITSLGITPEEFQTHDFTATVDWGDGTPATRDFVTFFAVQGSPAQGSPVVMSSGGHVYANAGTYTFHVTILRDGQVDHTVTGTAEVGNNPWGFVMRITLVPPPAPILPVSAPLAGGSDPIAVTPAPVTPTPVTPAPAPSESSAANNLVVDTHAVIGPLVAANLFDWPSFRPAGGFRLAAAQHRAGHSLPRAYAGRAQFPRVRGLPMMHHKVH